MKSYTTVSIIALICIVFLVYCKKDAVPLPTCIQQKVDSIKGTAERTPPAEVHVWTYNGRKVYLFNASCCNGYVKVFDETCKYVCSPSGGPINIGDSLCTDFYQTAKYIGLLFKDNR
jgi:hypothetical protein